MPRPWPGFNLFRFGSTPFSLLPIQAHPRNIPLHAAARKWKTNFLLAFLPRAVDPMHPNSLLACS
jgi:hypothetical protein